MMKISALHALHLNLDHSASLPFSWGQVVLHSSPKQIVSFNFTIFRYIFVSQVFTFTYSFISLSLPSDRTCCRRCACISHTKSATRTVRPRFRNSPLPLPQLSNCSWQPTFWTAKKNQQRSLTDLLWTSPWTSGPILTKTKTILITSPFSLSEKEKPLSTGSLTFFPFLIVYFLSLSLLHLPSYCLLVSPFYRVFSCFFLSQSLPPLPFPSSVSQQRYFTLTVILFFPYRTLFYFLQNFYSPFSNFPCSFSQNVNFLEKKKFSNPRIVFFFFNLRAFGNTQDRCKKNLDLSISSFLFPIFYL